ncbi:lipopolysaccharide biosynthesis protein [Georgenia wangjunii]|uniref:lipopolysaccharide biosynthesis protein n=1 Tax=Georgenia wangjunii TaxID=3117730 RepID=UPI002F26067B
MFTLSSVTAGITARISPGVRGLGKLMSGTIVGQVLVLASMPLLSRLYTPDSFGVFTAVVAVAVMVGPLATGRYELAIAIPAKDSDAVSVAFVSLIMAVATGVMGTLVILASGELITTHLGHHDLYPWILYVPLISSVAAAFTVLHYLALRRQRYGAIARRSVIRSLVLVTYQCGAGLVSPTPAGLLLGQAAGEFAGVVSLLSRSSIRAAWRRNKVRPLRAHLGRLWLSAKVYLRFPLLLAPSGLLNVAGVHLPVVLVSGLYGPAVAGWLGMAQRSVSVPVALVAASVAQVFLARFARAVREEDPGARTLFIRTFRRLSAAAVLTTVTILVAAPTLLHGLLGSEWSMSGDYARPLAIAVGCQILAVPLTQALIVLQKTRTQVGWDFARVVVVVASLYLSRKLDAPPLTALWVYSVCAAAMHLIALALSYRAVAQHFGRDVRNAS